MIISELIDKLKELPQDLLVLGRGYESGYDKIDDITISKVGIVPDASWFDGKYNNDNYYNKTLDIDAVILT